MMMRNYHSSPSGQKSLTGTKHRVTLKKRENLPSQTVGSIVVRSTPAKLAEAIAVRNTGNSGKVYLIGAGPGDPELLTLRGLRVLMQADVVLYDRLIDPRLLNYAPAHARLVYVGKQPGQAHSQAWIQCLMIAEARKGQNVVRLKGGDPFVFGRGGEEAEALAQAGIPCEIVPGVTSAIAVPALAGIPVLHRDHSNTLTVVSGHRCSQDEIATWATSLSQSGTLVILMGVANLGSIANGLQQAGIPADMPVAVTQSGLGRAESTVVSTLAHIEAEACHMTSPAVIVIGQVVGVRRRLQLHADRSAPVTSRHETRTLPQHHWVG